MQVFFCPAFVFFSAPFSLLNVHSLLSTLGCCTRTVLHRGRVGAAVVSFFPLFLPHPAHRESSRCSRWATLGSPSNHSLRLLWNITGWLLVLAVTGVGHWHVWRILKESVHFNSIMAFTFASQTGTEYDTHVFPEQLQHLLKAFIHRELTGFKYEVRVVRGLVIWVDSSETWMTDVKMKTSSWSTL